VPFCTHGSGGQARVLKDITKQCPGATVLDGFEIYGSGSGDTQAKISAWLRKIGVV
jgi:flavodoxin